MRSRGWDYGLVVLGLILAGALAIRYLGVQKRVDVSTSVVRMLEAEWTKTSPYLAEAKTMQPKFTAIMEHTARASGERQSPRWTPALRSLVACAGAGIELRDVDAREEAGGGKIWTLRVGGFSKGAAPRAVADQFRLALQGEFDGAFAATVSTRFERLDEMPNPAPARADEKLGVFTIVATIAFTDPAKAEGE